MAQSTQPSFTGSAITSLGAPDTPERDRLVSRVEAQLQDLDRHVPTLCEVAKSLGYSERSLRRHLSSRQTSYGAILREVRLKRATQWLIASDLTVFGIAERLGYTEATNFRQAFRRWVGCSPQTFRLARSTSEMWLLDAA